jgi:3D-(3,5/4)-trihydroxycyclohexane-1,2-dione acylhydrolase (decyclizing)
MKTIRLTTAQAVIRFLTRQYVARDGEENPFFAGCFGIFGHGNVAGIGQALQQHPDFRYYLPRNEQAMVHTAAAFAKMKNRLQTFACTSSIGPGATNMITAAAGATINRLPVLLLPGDIFARRDVGTVLQQLEYGSSGDVSVNDCFRPISKYWDRINRPEQLLAALPQAMRVLTSPADTGAVTICLPQDVQAEAHDFPLTLFEPRTWHIPRTRPDRDALIRAAEVIRTSRRPILIAGGGVHYSGATELLGSFAERTGIPVVETQAGKGALPYSHPLCLGAIGVTGTRAANIIAREADVVIGVGTRYSDFTTASRTAFQAEGVRFININVAEVDAFKHSGTGLVGDARETLEELVGVLGDYAADEAYRQRASALAREWDEEVSRLYDRRDEVPAAQSAVVGAVNRAAAPRGVVVCAAGSLPGDLHKLWRTHDTKGYHLEYGYSCMGYEIAGGLGVKMADPGREVYVMVGDGSYLMMSEEIVTSIQEGIKLTIIVLNNHGFASIGGLSESVGSNGFGTRYLRRNESGYPADDRLKVDFTLHARSLGAEAIAAEDIASLERALEKARSNERTTVITIETDRDIRVPSYESWWDVPVAEVSEMTAVETAREQYEKGRTKQRHYL